MMPWAVRTVPPPSGRAPQDQLVGGGGVDQEPGQGDVGDGIERADLVEMHRFDGRAVDLRLGFGEAGEDVDRDGGGGGGERGAALQHGADVAQMAVGVLVRRFDHQTRAGEAAYGRAVERRARRTARDGRDQRERLGLEFRERVEHRRGEHVARHAADRVEMQVARHGHAAAWKGTT